MHLGSVELMGLQTNILYLKPISWNPLGSLMKYYLLFEKCFSALLEYLLLKKSIACQILFYLKKGLDHHSPITKAKKLRVFEQFFTDPPEGGSAKVLPAGSRFGGTFAPPSSGGHPGPGVNVLLILFNFPAKITNKMAVGQKIFK